MRYEHKNENKIRDVFNIVDDIVGLDDRVIQSRVV